MSFAFPKPVPGFRTSSSVSGSDSDFDVNEYYYELLWQPGPDYDELIVPLSLYAFNRLSPSDQREQLEEISRHNVNVKVEESSDFTELFKKLNYSQQQKLLSKILQKFKREAIIPGMFRSLLLLPGKILRKVIKMIHPMIMESGSCVFDEFFLGFSIIWFQGQLASGQDMLIEQLSKGVGGTVVIEPRLQDDETVEDFKLRRFTELCKKIVDFRVQEKFLDNVERKLEMWGYHFSDRLILEPQEYDRAAELLSHLSTLGCSLLSAKYHQHKIEEMSTLVEGGVTIIEETTHDDDEDFRMTRFTELFNQVQVPTRIDLFKELREILLQEKHYSEAVRFFRGLGSEDQTEMIDKLTDKIIKYSWEECDPAEFILEKFSGESEEDFRLRRFKKVCSKHVSTCGYIVRPEAYQQRVRQGTSEESSPYASFLFDASITWFKARCANYRRNPIHVILFGQVDPFRDVIEKVPEESEEDFRLRRFTESFKQLGVTFQDGIVDYIQDTLFGDLGYPVCYARASSFIPPSEGRGSFDAEWIKLKLPHLQDHGAAAATTTTRGATSQAGGGRGQGTSTSTVR